VSVLFLVGYAWEVIGDLHGAAAAVPEAIIWITWAVFAADYLVCLSLARPRGRWFIRHLPELAIVVLPALRPLRLVRVVGLAFLFEHATRHALRGRVAAYAAVGAVILVLLAALAVLDAEQNEPGANITNFGDALWWAFVTVTTVGYGDLFPVSTMGRIVAVALMIAGIALLGTVTATIASLFTDLVADKNSSEERITRDQIAELSEKAD
jgi:voltage-gated potassium channel